MPSLLAGRQQPRIVLATCRTWPELSPSDQCFAAALQAHGAQATAAAWNVEDDQLAFRQADLVVIRGTWDYHDDLSGYRSWLATLVAEGVTVLNDPETVARFLDKSVFASLAGHEVTMPRCQICSAEQDVVAGVLATQGWSRAVLKPIHGASGRGVRLVTPGTVEEALAAVVSDVGNRTLLVQEFIPEIAAGETQYVLFDGRVSHAVLKRPHAGEFRTNSAFGPEIGLVDPLPAAKRIEAMVGRMAVLPLYARVDVVMRGALPVLLELEVNEPGLWLDIAPKDAADTFARATLVRLRM